MRPALTDTSVCSDVTPSVCVCVCVSCSAGLWATFTARSFSAVEGNRTAVVSVQLMGRTAVPVTVRVTPFGLNTTAAATGQTHTHTHTHTRARARVP